MSIKNVENMQIANSLYSMRDKAFFHVQQRMLEAFAKIEEKRAAVLTKEALLSYVEESKRAFRETMGTLPYDPTLPFDTRVTKTLEEDGLTIKNLLFRARENVYISANLYLPAIREEKAPAVLLQCGHSKNGKAAAPYQNAARKIAARGIIVLVTDPVGQGERQQYADENGAPIVEASVSNHQQFGTQCFLNGESPVKYFLADAVRSVDFLCSLEETDSERIGATGNSGGGTMTAVLMAYDDRIKAAAPSCWPCAGKEYFLSGGAADCEQIWPNVLSSGVDVFEIMACMCPKPLLLLNAAYDFIPIEGVRRLFAETKRLYRLAGVEDRVRNATADEPHGFSEPLACAASDFFAEFLGARQEYIEGFSFKTRTDADLYATESGLVLKDFPNDLSIWQENVAEYHRKNALLTEEEKRAALEALVFNGRAKEYPTSLRYFKSAWGNYYDDGLWVQGFVWFTGDMLPCFGVMLCDAENKDKSLPVTLCLWSDGTSNLQYNADKIREICDSGRAAFIVDLTSMGKNLPYKMKGSADEKDHLTSITDKITKSLYMIGDSLGAIKAYDLIQTIRMVRSTFSPDLSLYAKGNYAILARIAQKLDPSIPCECDHEVKVRDLIEKKYYNGYDISHIVIPNIAQYID